MRYFARTLLALTAATALTAAARAEGTPEAPPDITAPVFAPPADMQVDAADIQLVPAGQTSSIPEPTHLAMYGLAAASLLYRRFRRPTPEKAS